MNKYLLKIFFAGLGICFLFLGACKKNNVVVDQDPLIPPTFAKFNVVQSAIYSSDSTATYYVKSTNAPFKIPVGVTNVSDKDRTVQFTYTSPNATQGNQYSAPTTLTIAKKTALDSLVISGNFANINIGEVDTIVIQIQDTDEMPMSPYKNKFTVYMRKSCPINILDFEGTYNNTYDNGGSYGPYITVVTPGSIVSTPTSATFTIENIWDSQAGTVTTVNADWSVDPDHPTITIPDQEYYAPLDVWIIGTGTPSSFSPCEGTITLNYTLYYHTTGADFSANQETVMTR